nr:hypothetical protein [Chloroflexota bacterium]
MRSSLRTAAVLVLITGAMSLATQPGSAHERRNLGPYQVVVGWLGEPAFAGVMNAVDFRVTDTRSTPAKPVEGLEKTLTVEVFQGGSITPFSAPFRARFGTPGAYAADILPTRAGDYRFVVKGKIETLDVNETFESGPGRFDEIRPATALQPGQGAERGGARSRPRRPALDHGAGPHHRHRLGRPRRGGTAPAFHSPTDLVRTISILALALCGLGLAAQAADAHAWYLRSNPASDARLQRSPAEVRVSFTEPPDPGGSEIQV